AADGPSGTPSRGGQASAALCQERTNDGRARARATARACHGGHVVGGQRVAALFRFWAVTCSPPCPHTSLAVADRPQASCTRIVGRPATSTCSTSNGRS